MRRFHTISTHVVEWEKEEQEEVAERNGVYESGNVEAFPGSVNLVGDRSPLSVHSSPTDDAGTWDHSTSAFSVRRSLDQTIRRSDDQTIRRSLDCRIESKKSSLRTSRLLARSSTVSRYLDGIDVNVRGD